MRTPAGFLRLLGVAPDRSWSTGLLIPAAVGHHSQWFALPGTLFRWGSRISSR